MSEQIDGSAIRLALVECAEELSALQSSNSMSYIEVEQRHGRADGKLVDLHDRNGAPVLERKEDGNKVISESFVGSLGGVCLGCPVWEAGDGCALRESFHEVTADMRAKREEIEYKEPTVATTPSSSRKPKVKRTRVAEEVVVKELPEEQRAENEDAQIRDARIQQIAETASAHEGAVAAIYRARNAGYAYPGAATRLKQGRNELNQDHTDHISEDK